MDNFVVWARPIFLGICIVATIVACIVLYKRFGKTTKIILGCWVVITLFAVVAVIVAFVIITSVATPSIYMSNVSRTDRVPRYYSQPWEITADIFGGVNRRYREAFDLANNALTTHSMPEILAGLMYWEFLMTSGIYTITHSAGNIILSGEDITRK